MEKSSSGGAQQCEVITTPVKEKEEVEDQGIGLALHDEERANSQSFSRLTSPVPHAPNNTVLVGSSYFFGGSKEDSKYLGNPWRQGRLHSALSWILVGGMALSALYVIFVMATYTSPAYYAWEKKYASWVNKNLARFYSRIFIEFLRTGAPMLVFSLCGVIYIHKSKGFVSSASPTFGRMMQTLRRPTFFFTRWFSLGELIFIAFIGILVPLWTYQLADYRFIAEDVIEGSKLSQWIEFLGRGFGSAGYLSGFFMLFPIARGAFWMKLLHTSYDQAVKYHRWLSRVTIACFILHSLLYYVAWWMRGTWVTYAFPSAEYERACVCDEVAAQKKECLCSRHIRHTWQNVYGLISCVLFGIVWLTSLEIVRRKNFELFYYSHFLFIPAFYLGILHRESFGFYWYPGFILYMIARIKIGVTMSRHVVIKDCDYCEESGIFRMELQRSRRRIDQFSAGQYIFINVPALSALQSHPFSISSAPADNPGTLTVHGKVLGNWTAQLAALIRELKQQDAAAESLVVKADGYYGNPPPCSLSEHVVLVAGGIGVTPVLSILSDCYHRYLVDPHSAPKSVKMYWAVRSKSTAKPFMELLENVSKIPHVFQIELFVTNHSTTSALQGSVDSAALPSLPPCNPEMLRKIPSKKPGPLQPRKLSCWQDALLHGGVWTVSYLSVMLLWYGFLLAFEKGKKPEKYRWYYMRIIEPLLFFGFGSLFSYLVYTRTKTSDEDMTPLAASIEMQNQSSSIMVNSVLSSTDANLRIVENERPDIPTIFRSLHDDQPPSSPYQVFVAGPTSLHNAVKESTRCLSNRHLFSIHYDQYEL